MEGWQIAVGIIFLIALVALIVWLITRSRSNSPATPTLSSPVVSSPDFVGGNIASGITCTGTLRSPAVNWSNIPAGTQEIALTIQDSSGKTNWLVYNIPPSVTGLIRQGEIQRSAQLRSPDTVGVGLSDYNTISFATICPAPGTSQQYTLTIYFLNAPSRLSEGASRAAFNSALTGKVISSASIAGSYSRPAAPAPGPPAR